MFRKNPLLKPAVASLGTGFLVSSILNYHDHCKIKQESPSVNGYVNTTYSVIKHGIFAKKIDENEIKEILKQSEIQRVKTLQIIEESKQQIAEINDMISKSNKRS